MEIVDNQAIKLTLPKEVVVRIKDNIKKCEIIKTHGEFQDILVYWGIDEMMKLNQLLRFKNPLPSPISRDYNYPGIYKPFEHQKVTSEFLSINHKAFCFNEAGTGKTSSIIWAADHLMNLGKIKRVLVICPLSIMFSAWQGDIFNTAIHRTSAVAHGAKEKRVKIINSEYEFIIINFDN